MKGTHFSDVDFTAQLFFQIDKQSPRKPRRRARAGLYQQVQVAILAGVTPGKGTEHPHTLNAVPGSYGKNRVTFAQLINGHALPFSHPPRILGERWVLLPLNGKDGKPQWRVVWLGRRDSNPDTRLQRPQSYR